MLSLTNVHFVARQRLKQRRIPALEGPAPSYQQVVGCPLAVQVLLWLLQVDKLTCMLLRTGISTSLRLHATFSTNLCCIGSVSNRY